MDDELKIAGEESSRANKGNAFPIKDSARLLFGLVVITLACGCRTKPPEAPAAASVADASPTASGASYELPAALASLNGLFLEGYANRQAMVKSNTNPIIVGSFSSLILYWDGRAETNQVIPDIYHALKVVAHVPFGIFLRLAPCADMPDAKVPATVLEELKLYPDRVAEAEVSLSKSDCTPAQLERQKVILSESAAFLRHVMETGQIPRKELLSFAHKMGPLMLANADDAAVAQLDVTHKVVMQWKRKIPPNKWKRLVVVVRGPQMPRRLNIFTQYFARLLGEPSHHLGYPLEGRRLIYAETIMSGRDYLDLMATTFIDGDASEAFFGGRWRMSRDVLADGAAKHLKRLNFE